MADYETRILVDWDGDGVFNGSAVAGAPANVFTSSPFLGRAFLRGIQHTSGDTLVTETLEDTGRGLRKFEVTFGWTAGTDYAEEAQFGFDYTQGDPVTPYSGLQHPLKLQSNSKYNVSVEIKSTDGSVKEATLEIFSRPLFGTSETSEGTATESIDTDWSKLSVAFETTDPVFVFGVITVEVDDGAGGQEPAGLDAVGTAQFSGFDIRRNGVADAGSNPSWAWQAGDQSNGYDNLSTTALSANWTLGREEFKASMPFEGTLTVTLNNDDKRYSPNNEDSPLFGYLRENLRVVVQMRITGEQDWITLWSGWTKSYDAIAGVTTNRQATLLAGQGLERIRLGDFRMGLVENKRVDEAVPILFNASTFIPASSTYFGRFDTARFDDSLIFMDDGEMFAELEEGEYPLVQVGQSWGVDTDLVTALREVLDSENAMLWLDREGAVHVVNRQHFVNTARVFDPANEIFTTPDGQQPNVIPEPRETTNMPQQASTNAQLFGGEIPLDTISQNALRAGSVMNVFMVLSAGLGTSQYVRLGLNDDEDETMIEAQPATDYTFKMWIHESANLGVNMMTTVRVRMHSWNGTALSEIAEETFTVAGLVADNTDMYPVSFTFTSDPDTTHLVIELGYENGDEGTPASTNGYAFAGLMIVEGTNEPPYFWEYFTPVGERIFLDLDNEAHGARYRYGADIINKVRLRLARYRVDQNVIVWESPSPIELKARTKLRGFAPIYYPVNVPIDFRYESDDVKAVTGIRERFENRDVTAYRHRFPDRVNRQNYAVELTDDQIEQRIRMSLIENSGRWYLQMVNISGQEAYVSVTLYGDAVIGGERDTYEFDYPEGIQASGGTYVEEAELNSSFAADEAQAYADYIFLKHGLPRGEYYTVTVKPQHIAALRNMVNMTVGRGVFISETQTGGEELPHIIIGERGTLIGTYLELEYNLSAADDTYFLQNGDVILPERILSDPMEQLGIAGTGGARVSDTGISNPVNQDKPALELDFGRTDYGTVVVGETPLGQIPLTKVTAAKVGASTTLQSASRFARWRDYEGLNDNTNDRVAIQTGGAFATDYVEVQLQLPTEFYSKSGALLIGSGTAMFLRFFVLADDPISGHDPRFQIQVRDNVGNNLTTGTTISGVISSYDGEFVVDAPIQTLASNDFPITVRIGNNSPSAPRLFVVGGWTLVFNSTTAQTPSGQYSTDYIQNALELINEPELYVSGSVDMTDEMEVVLHFSFRSETYPDEVYYRIFPSSIWHKLVDEVDEEGRLVVDLADVTSQSSPTYVEFRRKLPDTEANNYGVHAMDTRQTAYLHEVYTINKADDATPYESLKSGLVLVNRAYI